MNLEQRIDGLSMHELTKAFHSAEEFCSNGVVENDSTLRQLAKEEFHRDSIFDLILISTAVYQRIARIFIGNKS